MTLTLTLHTIYLDLLNIYTHTLGRFKNYFNFFSILATQDGISLRNPSSTTENTELFQNACQTSTTQTTTTTTVDIEKRTVGSFGRIWLKFYSQWHSLPWERLKSVKWKNERATQPGAAYMPTEVRQKICTKTLTRHDICTTFKQF